MHRFKQSLSESKRVAQPKSEAWSVKKSSTHRVSPYTKQEVSQLLKAGGSKGSVPKLKSKRDPSKTKSSKVLGDVKAALVQDSRNFNVQLKALEPTIKSLSPRLISKAPDPPDQPRHHFRKLRARPNHEQESPLFSEDDIMNLHKGPPTLPGEKLITIGGYIVSLQGMPQNITGVVRPRVSSDKEGFELEIKILGCHPSDIKFEKRYDTLIVIGIAKIPIKRPDEPKINNLLGYLMEGRSRSKDRELRSSIIGSRGYPNSLPPTDHLDDMYEVINIFVPKNISLNQIFISKPDTKGRIFVKGP